MLPLPPQDYMRGRLMRPMAPPPIFRNPIQHAMPGQQMMPIGSEQQAMSVLRRMQGEPAQDQVRQAIRTKFPRLPEPEVRPATPLPASPKTAAPTFSSSHAAPTPTGRNDSRFSYRGAYEATSQDLANKGNPTRGMQGKLGKSTKETQPGAKLNA